MSGPYSVKEIFYSLQGEGARTGRPAVFCRFAGCNLWSGREQDRSNADCDFCDTDFVGIDGQGGGRFEDATSLARELAGYWPEQAGAAKPYVVCTGGEPLLQLDAMLIDALHQQGFEVAVETNGTLPAPPGIDWLCVSPKGATTVVVKKGDELKLVYPQANAMPGRFEGFDFDYFFLQPLDSPALADNMRQTLEYCLQHPRWRLSLQTHKTLGIR